MNKYNYVLGNEKFKNQKELIEVIIETLDTFDTEELKELYRENDNLNEFIHFQDMFQDETLRVNLIKNLIFKTELDMFTDSELIDILNYYQEFKKGGNQ
jgi:hypothetical protein